MSETDDDSTLKKLAGLFVKLDDEAEVPEAQAPSPDAEASAPVTPSPQVRVASGDMETVMTSDFKTLYEKTGVTGDPNTEPILNAFEGMKSLAGGALQTAMDAMMGALRADVSSITDTLNRRSGILAVALQQQKDRIGQERQQRAGNLESVRAKTEQEIRLLEKKIGALRSELQTCVESTQQQDAHDQGAIAGFEQRVSQEKLRIEALKDFLEKSPGPSGATDNR